MGGVYSPLGGVWTCLLIFVICYISQLIIGIITHLTRGGQLVINYRANIRASCWHRLDRWSLGGPHGEGVQLIAKADFVSGLVKPVLEISHSSFT